MRQKRLLVGISGASGMPLAVEVLRALKASGIETHLICTDSAARTLSLETNLALEDLQGLSHTVYDNRNIDAAHLRNMYEVSQAGAVILPPVLSYYNHPQSVEDMTRHVAGKILDQFGVEFEGFQRWEGK